LEKTADKKIFPADIQFSHPKSRQDSLLDVSILSFIDADHPISIERRIFLKITTISLLQ
jgi:hypothetical protein